MRFFPALIFIALFAACNNSKPCVEKIDPACICPADYDPVCGCNNKTYSNACQAECSGITSYVKGECAGKPTAKLEGPVWRLKVFGVGPEPITVPDNIDIHVRFENGDMSGNGGCNNIGGAYEIAGNKLLVPTIISTKMYCDNAMQHETRFLQMLEKSRTYTFNADNLEIDCGDMGVLVFSREK